MATSLVFLMLAQALTQVQTFSDFHRVKDEPILSPRANSFDSAGAFNPAVAEHKGKVIMLYRAQDKEGVSRVGFAESADGITFSASKDALLGPKEAYEKDGGLEDPRLVKIGNLYYLTYTGYNKKDAQLCLAVSSDLRNWNRMGVIMPAGKGTWNVRWTKSGAIIPKQIDGKYWMFYMGDGANGGNDQTGLAWAADPAHTWLDATKEPILPRRPGMFDSRVVEPGPAPIFTRDGILLIYNGADDNLVYRTGWALFDKNDPRKLIARCNKPIFVPEKKWEKEGQVPNVVFVEGALKKGKKWLFYYGGADSHVGVAESTMTDLKIENEEKK